MGATVSQVGAIWEVHLTGMLHKAELDAMQLEAIDHLSADHKAVVLILAEDFEGWQRGDVWGDVSFVSRYGDRIAKIAIVAAAKWEDRFLMFTGAGLRSTQIRFFPTAQLAAARAWLQA